MKLCNLGVYHDMVYALERYFNTGKVPDGVELKDVPQNLLAFFYKKGDGGSFMAQILRESFAELMEIGNVSVIQNKLSNVKAMINRITNFYFDQTISQFPEKKIQFICDMHQLIVKSSYPYELKNALYAFFITPSGVIAELMQIIFALDLQLHSAEAECYTIEPELEKELQNIAATQKIDDNQHVWCAITVLDDTVIETVPLGRDEVLLLVGKNYQKRFATSPDELLYNLGCTLTDKNRIRLLNLMQEKGEVTVLDISQDLNLTGTNAYYHVSLMVKCGILKTRAEDRRVFYSIDKTNIEFVCQTLFEYAKNNSVPF